MTYKKKSREVPSPEKLVPIPGKKEILVAVLDYGVEEHDNKFDRPILEGELIQVKNRLEEIKVVKVGFKLPTPILDKLSCFGADNACIFAWTPAYIVEASFMMMNQV